MSRRLLAPLVLGAVLLLGTSAPACVTCDAPPASALETDPPPQAPFEAAAPGALLAEEREWLLTLEDGRYEEVNGRLSDRKAAAGEHLLPNSAAWALLGRRATERTAALRPLVKNGRLPEEVRGEAVALFWLRGSLVSPEDRDFLRAATLPEGKPEGPGELEAGAKPPEGVTAAGDADPAAPAAAAAQAADILRSLRASLDIAPNADPKAVAAMDAALVSLVSTPTGRELALEFTASGSRAKLEFGEVPNSTTIMMNGRRILRASGGHTFPGENPPRVVLNRDYLVTDPDFRRVNMTATLGHELFGHAFEVQRAKKEGISRQTLYHYRGDEAGSGLIGWLVHAELGGRLDNGHMWNYLADPERYHTGLKTNLPYYATTLSLAEMRAPVATLESRVAVIDTARKSGNAYAASMVAWTPRIAHFVAAHGMDEAQFSSLTEDITAAVVWNNSQQASLDNIHTHLTGTIARWKKPESDALKAELAAAAGSAYLRQAEARLTARSDRLRGIVGNRTREATIPPVPGKLTWDDLHRLFERDQKDNPGHWGKTR